MMNMPPANLMENPMKTHNLKNYKKAKGVSFFAFLLTIVIYISIFYIFSLSPSVDLLHNTNFWFVISNTLIFIIAAGNGSFSSKPKENPDLYHEYALHRQAAASSRALSSSSSSSSSSSFTSQYSEVVKKSIDDTKEQNEGESTPEKILEAVKIECKKYPTDNFQAKSQQVDQENKRRCDVVNKNNIEAELKTIRRSKSDKVKPDTFHDKNILKRSKTERLEPIITTKENLLSEEDQENEFTTMSDEELNRRVEEFIQKFNRQIRLQAMS